MKLNNSGVRIVSFLNRAPLPVVSILDQSNITEFKSADEAVIIAYLPEGEKALKEAFIELASRNHDKFTFGFTSDKNIAKAEDIQIPAVVVHKPKEGEQEVLPGPSGIDALEKFLETATASSIGEFTRRNELKYMKASLALPLLKYLLTPEKSRPESHSSTTSALHTKTAKRTGNH
jgi:protein disulfide-isomerase A1